VSQQHKPQPSHYAYACPTVGENVLAISFEDEQLRPASDPEKLIPESRVEQTSRER